MQNHTGTFSWDGCLTYPPALPLGGQLGPSKLVVLVVIALDFLAS